MSWLDWTLMVSLAVGFISLVGMSLCSHSMVKRYRPWKEDLGNLLFVLATMSATVYIAIVITFMIGAMS